MSPVKHTDSRPRERVLDYGMRTVDGMAGLDPAAWNALAAGNAAEPQPFLRHEYLVALEAAGCVGGRTGWLPRHLQLTDATGAWVAAAPMYLKLHSRGEYVFDWAWADAYERHGLRYYPKLLVAVPFTPVAGPRLLAIDSDARHAAAMAMVELARSSSISSLHVLFAPDEELQALQANGAMRRDGLQFHWRNRGWTSFDDFLTALAQPKRKKIRAERRKVSEAGVHVVRRHGRDIREADWVHFHRCYSQTYAEHGSTPYLNLAFFLQIAETMPQHLVLATALHADRPIAASLLMIDGERVYGRYWGALEYVPCLHFELCYYQAVELALELGLPVVEGGAQGEHKLARGFEPVPTASTHWLAEPAFADAVDRFLQQERPGVAGYMDELREHAPFRSDR